MQSADQPAAWQGRYFEDLHPGDVYRCRYGRTVTEAENTQFTLLTNNTNQVHFNRDYAEQAGFGGILVNSLLTLSIVTGMSVFDVSENAIALGWEDIRLPHPVHPGDTLYEETEVLEARQSQSRPDQGIVKVQTRGFNQRGEVVIEFRRSILVWKRGKGPASARTA
jgi:itaconyl-CoA hydratase